jgi:hypothetical protein
MKEARLARNRRGNKNFLIIWMGDSRINCKDVRRKTKLRVCSRYLPDPKIKREHKLAVGHIPGGFRSILRSYNKNVNNKSINIRLVGGIDHQKKLLLIK